MVEILAPVGNFAMLNAAVNAGADAVYFGIQGLNMRESAKNFTVEDLKEFPSSVKKYLALNTIIYDSELEKVKAVLLKVKDYIDAVICWDLAVVRIAKELGIDVHLSTQASVANVEAIKMYKDLGVTRVILARELSLEQIKFIKDNVDIEIEVFIHGAMCVSYSGRCFLSQDIFNRSANRGKCIQPCRRNYKIIDTELGHELELGSQSILSAKDLCTMPFFEKILDLGVDGLKIEGRAKTPEYVDIVVRAYRRAVDEELTDELKEELMKELEKSYNRGFSSGFYLNEGSQFTKEEGNVSEIKKEQIGIVVNYYKEKGVAALKLFGDLEKGDSLLVTGNKTGVVRTTVEDMQIEHKKVEKASKCLVAIKMDLVRENDKVFKISKI
ncbi:MAG: peptidase U32 family protein [archaeon]